jgi:hypothetical protein
VTSPRLLTWSIHETGGFDSAWATLDADARTLAASGRATGQRPSPYWLTYELETDGDYVTRRATVEARTPNGTKTLDLRRDARGWTANGEARADLADALDCDLAGCPLTNTMPILRHRMHETQGGRSFLMAYIRVPELRVVRSEQRYTHLYRLGDGSAIVRYRSGGFEDDLTVDPDGFVVDYPKLGRRVEP